jgi:hypothetical protein
VQTLGGFRGVAESATIFTPAALIGAIHDALRPLGVMVDSTRAHPRHLRALLQTDRLDAGP